MESEILNKIKLFVYDLGWGFTLPYPFLFKKKKITSNTELVRDLKINGDDSDEFLMAYSKEFNVDVSKFKIDDYFGDEGDVVLSSIIKTLNGSERKHKKILTIGNLEDAVLAGRLDEEIIKLRQI
jgi:hypothetical protein